MPGRAASRVLEVDPEHPQPEVLAEAARVLRSGGLVAFPTETVYGLGADALSAEAVARIFAAKGRPADNPLIVHVGHPQEVQQVAREVPPLARRLMERFWPGPLTLVLPKATRVPLTTTGGLDTVAVRMPAHPVALALVREAGVPVAAPSANRSGRPSPTRAEHVLQDLGDAVDLVLDGGPCPVGVESTVLDVTGPVPVVLRPGGLPKESIEAALGRPVMVGGGPELARRSPGTRYRHYAPGTPLLIAGPDEVPRVVEGLLRQGKTVGLLARRDPGLRHPQLRTRIVTGGLRAYARELFDALRSLDDQGCEVIVAEAVDEKGIGLAIMDRLRRAAS